MKKMSKVILTALAVLVILVAPACRTNRKKVEPAVQPPVAEAPAPEVAPPPSTDTEVAPREDFVNDAAGPREEVMPTEIEALNRWAQEKGYIRDAYFNYAEATLDGAAQEALQASATWLKGEGAGYNLLIEGHCDERGTEQYNLALGDRRANTARQFLTALGIDGNRLRTVSYGEERPFATGSNESAWSQNRRAHLVIVGTR